MSNPRFPPELLDHVIDHLQDTRDALESCCLVSKSQIPRTRKHLFAHVRFRTTKDLQSWKSTFPNPSTSPAYHYAQTLTIDFFPTITAADAEEGGWIPAFSRVVCFEVGTHDEDRNGPTTSLSPFHGFSSALKSLRVAFTALPSSDVFNLIYSFPHLEDLWIVTNHHFDSSFGGRQAAIQPPIPPPFTGTLKLFSGEGMDSIASWLLSLPKGPNFEGLYLVWGEDTSLMTALVEKCSLTLKYLRIDSLLCLGDDVSDLVNLTKATKLESLAFMCRSCPLRISMTLRTITPNHRNLRQISICITHTLSHVAPHRIHPTYFKLSVSSDAHQQWLELDRLLVQLWESHAIRLRVLYDGSTSTVAQQKMRGCIECFFPETVARGIVDMISYHKVGWRFCPLDWGTFHLRELV